MSFCCSFFYLVSSTEKGWKLKRHIMTQPLHYHSGKRWGIPTIVLLRISKAVREGHGPTVTKPILVFVGVSLCQWCCVKCVSKGEKCGVYEV